MDNKNREILDAFRFRYACKRFDPDKEISKEDFDTILEAAHLSPSSFGLEPWKILVLQDKDIKEKLAPIAWGALNSLSSASRFVILLARKKNDLTHGSEYLTHMIKNVQKRPDDLADRKRETFLNFQKNDFNLLDNDRSLFDWASKQTYIVLANMLTAAALLRIDSCPIEGFDQKAADALLAAEGVMDLEHFGVSVMAGFGYRQEVPRPKVRQPLQDVVIWK